MHPPGDLGPIFLASSNAGKLREYRALASADPHLPRLTLELLPKFSGLPPFEESEPTFAENAAGKAIHFSRLIASPVMADDSGLQVEALAGAPGVHSARYAGPNASDADRMAKLLEALRDVTSGKRGARFRCVLALAKRGCALGVFSGSVTGEILEQPRGTGGFGYDPLFFVPALGKTFAELPEQQKNAYSHRGQAFQRLLAFLTASSML